MNGLKSVAHVRIKSPDLARTLDLYCGARGLERRFDFTKGGQVVGSRGGRDGPVWVTDPSGARFEFHQYTEQSAQFAVPGGAVEVSW